MTDNPADRRQDTVGALQLVALLSTLAVVVLLAGGLAAWYGVKILLAVLGWLA
jgi:hypothetical protein